MKRLQLHVKKIRVVMNTLDARETATRFPTCYTRHNSTVFLVWERNATGALGGGLRMYLRALVLDGRQVSYMSEADSERYPVRNPCRGYELRNAESRLPFWGAARHSSVQFYP